MVSEVLNWYKYNSREYGFTNDFLIQGNDLKIMTSLKMMKKIYLKIALHNVCQNHSAAAHVMRWNTLSLVVYFPVSRANTYSDDMV